MSPNARWQIADDQVYHLVARGNNRMHVFHDSSDFQYYLALIARYKALYPILLFHYCLMPNHVHLLVKVLKAEDLKKFMQGLNQSYSNHYKRTYKHWGHLWQGRYKSFLIEQDSYLLECGRYIERNPLRAKLVKDPRDWPWSSYSYFGMGSPNPIVDEHGLYSDLGETRETRQAHYQAYILQKRPYETLLDKQFQITEAVRA